MPGERGARLAGVKMRMRTSASGARSAAGRTPSRFRFISRAIDCIFLGGQVAAVGENRELVPRERDVGEDVARARSESASWREPNGEGRRAAPSTCP